jgi:hypothetical protein
MVIPRLRPRSARQNAFSLVSKPAALRRFASILVGRRKSSTCSTQRSRATPFLSRRWSGAETAFGSWTWHRHHALRRRRVPGSRRGRHHQRVTGPTDRHQAKQLVHDVLSPAELAQLNRSGYLGVESRLSLGRVPHTGRTGNGQRARGTSARRPSLHGAGARRSRARARCDPQTAARRTARTSCMRDR